MAQVHLPKTLLELFPDAGRSVQVDSNAAASADGVASTSPTVGDVLDRLDKRWPGMKSRLCANATSLRRHIIVFVDSERAELTTAVRPDSEIRVVPALSGG